MYKVKFLKQIHSGFSTFQTGDLYVEVDTELPFIPVEGITYNIDVGQEYPLEISGDEIKEICYNQKENMFKIYTEEDKELYDRARKEKKSIGENYTKEEVLAVANKYIEYGWKFRK
jgi:hypothetical protein